MRYTVVGAGAIGGTLAFHLARAGHEVTAIDTDAAHVTAIRAGGLRIRRPDGTEETQPLVAMTPADLDTPGDDAGQGAGESAGPGAGAAGGVAEPFGAVILAVKAQATADAAAWIAPRLAPDGYVVSLQNGLCEPAIAEAVGDGRTVAAFVNLFADLVEPGVIADGGPGALVVGELDGTVSPRVRALVDDLQAWGPAVADGNVAGHLWSKLAYSAVAAASATVDAPVADTIEERPAMTAALAREIYAVAAAEGVRPEPFDAWRASAFLPGAAAADTAAGLADFCAWLRTQPKDKTGIWRDLAVRRRKTEVPAILGAALDRAGAHGLTCPGAEAVLRVIRDLEDGTRRLSPANLDEIEAATRTAPA